MPSGWVASNSQERGAYTTVAQTEDANAELTAHGRGVEDGELYVSLSSSILHVMF
jgi:hypothetical protein